MLTTIEVDVEDDWTNIVSKIPTIRPANWLSKIVFNVFVFPIKWPPISLNEALISSREQIKKYRQDINPSILAKSLSKDLNSSCLGCSIKDK